MIARQRPPSVGHKPALAGQGARIDLEHVGARAQTAVAVLALFVGDDPGAVFQVQAHARDAQLLAVLHAVAVAVHVDLASQAGLVGEDAAGDAHLPAGLVRALAAACAITTQTLHVGAVDAVALGRTHPGAQTVGDGHITAAGALAGGLGGAGSGHAIQRDVQLPIALHLHLGDAGVGDAHRAGLEEKEITFSNSYYTSEPVLLVRKDGKYASAQTLEDFKDAKITSQQGVYLYNLIDQLPGAKKETAMGDFAQMRQALESGVIDGYISERPEALTAETANPNFKMIQFEKGFEVGEEDASIAIGMRKDDDRIEASIRISQSSS